FNLGRMEATTHECRTLHNKVQCLPVEGHAVVTVSLKGKGEIPGDATAEQMRAVADLADRYAGGELRVTHRQNLVFPNVQVDKLAALYNALAAHGLATGNVGLSSDIIACPGLDYCALATARSIPLAQTLSTRLRAREAAAREAGRDESGPSINISGCINACGHHHAANIGILGLNKADQENYQITLGGRADEGAAVGELLGPGFSAEELPGAIDRLIDAFHTHREDGEDFVATYARIGKAPFKAAAYGSDDHVAV
ncbi:MAG: nitrite/sulfite reductase, partial [Pseudomonadota bacterium]